MTIPLSPCKGCADRHAACWDSCEKFKVFKAESDQVNAGRREYNKKINEHFVDIIRAQRRGGRIK